MDKAVFLELRVYSPLCCEFNGVFKDHNPTVHNSIHWTEENGGFGLEKIGPNMPLSHTDREL